MFSLRPSREGEGGNRNPTQLQHQRAEPDDGDSKPRCRLISGQEGGSVHDTCLIHGEPVSLFWTVGVDYVLNSNHPSPPHVGLQRLGPG
ncbi:hypothetical protein CesoFtcFv8_021572 [Champsocephalus esox]|uniref:Uncharacterized protein n=2 Tax=Champsocephalus TaxID=52236 RepID=A0AAN8CKA8_CHAGU|nr:hypothetical protein CesoFtcFv8_021572 [Champsocephalus esox]KAK5905426.1 hypothetical protein CgunFtcFv8_001393 [Champsocephalus gunnari]